MVSKIILQLVNVVPAISLLPFHQEFELYSLNMTVAFNKSKVYDYSAA